MNSVAVEHLQRNKKVNIIMSSVRQTGSHELQRKSALPISPGVSAARSGKEDIGFARNQGGRS